MVRFNSHNQNETTLSDREKLLWDHTFPEKEPHVFLQTCDRVEWYSGNGNVPEAVARHLFRVVSGLESSLIGESSIQGQVKKAYQESAEKYKLSASIHQLFQTALSVGKKVRTNSYISQGAVSHSQTVIELLRQENIELKNSLITLLGVNKLNEDVIRFLNAKSASSIFLGNRNLEKATTLADKFGCKAFRLDNLSSFLQFTDVLISATSAPHVLIHPEDLPTNRNMVIIDLAFPRDVDENVRNMPSITLYNLEDIRLRIQQNISNRREQLFLAEQIVESEVSIFCKRFNTNASSQFLSTIPSKKYSY